MTPPSGRPEGAQPDLAEAIAAKIQEIHDLLTPEQRRAIGADPSCYTCRYCVEGYPRNLSSIGTGAYVHNGTPVGRVVCRAGRPEVVEEAMEPSERAREAARSYLVKQPTYSQWREHDEAALALAFEEYGREVRREAAEAIKALREPCLASHFECDCRDCYWKRSKWRILDAAAAAVLRASPQGQAGER